MIVGWPPRNQRGLDSGLGERNGGSQPRWAATDDCDLDG